MDQGAAQEESKAKDEVTAKRKWSRNSRSRSKEEKSKHQSKHHSHKSSHGGLRKRRSHSKSQEPKHAGDEPGEQPQQEKSQYELMKEDWERKDKKQIEKMQQFKKPLPNKNQNQPQVNPNLPNQILMEVTVNDRLGTKERIKCLPTDTIDILKKLIAAKTGTRPEKIRLQRQHVVFKNHITLEDYEIKDGSGLEMYYN